VLAINIYYYNTLTRARSENKVSLSLFTTFN